MYNYFFVSGYLTDQVLLWLLQGVRVRVFMYPGNISARYSILLDFVQHVDIVVYLPRMLNVYSPMIFEVRPLNLYRDCNYLFASTFQFAIYVILRCLH